SLYRGFGNVLPQRGPAPGVGADSQSIWSCSTRFYVIWKSQVKEERSAPSNLCAPQPPLIPRVTCSPSTTTEPTDKDYHATAPLFFVHLQRGHLPRGDASCLNEMPRPEHQDEL